MYLSARPLTRKSVAKSCTWRVNWTPAALRCALGATPRRCLVTVFGLRERLPPDYRCRATRSDFWLAYDEAFPRRTHRSCSKEEGETCHVERWNCTLRQRLGRFVRKTLSLSKCDHMHELALRLFIHEYNQQPITY